MNYRHAYHAGNFADVLKHIVLTRIIEYMKLKPKPFRVIDTHAGIGLYDLDSVQAGKTGEWQNGIARVMAAAPSQDIAALLAPYLDAVRAHNLDGGLKQYPGSPLLARALMRPGDQLVANELHEEDVALLKDALFKVKDSKVLNLDAWHAIKSLLPPKERRGVVLIDPPFEKTDEFDRCADAVADALERFATGVMVVWFPVKNEGEVQRFLSKMRAINTVSGLEIRLAVRGKETAPGLAEAGVLVINPPFSLEGDMQKLLPFLRTALAQDNRATFRMDVFGN